MSELFTQNYSDKPLFHTDTEISEMWNAVQESQMPKSLENSWAAWLIMVYIQLLTLINKSVHINAKK